jgi:hypothetical protein
MMKNIELLESLDALLTHIRDIEMQSIEMSKASYLMFNGILHNHDITLNDEELEIMQYQDIVSQQLNATAEAIDAARKSIDFHKNSVQRGKHEIIAHSVEKLNQRLEIITKQAKKKHEAFAGNFHDNHDEEIEFF